TALALGDFNADGKVDIAATSSDGGLVSVLLQSATTAGTFGTARSVPTGSQPNSIAVADFNGDGKPDLVTSNSDSNNLGILLGTGGGNFAAATFVPLSSFPGDLAVTDLDSDGKPDIVVSAESSNSLALLLGFGDGTFFPSKITISKGSTGPFVVGDLNKDGK